MKWRFIFRNILVALALLPLLAQSSLPPGDPTERVRAFTRNLEFDFIEWTVNALWIKAQQAVLDIPHYMTEEQQKQTVKTYLALVDQIDRLEAQIKQIYADPKIKDKTSTVRPVLDELKQLQAQRNWLGALCESILQQQISATLTDLNLSIAGQPIPPLLYRVTPLPLALIVSPRRIIRQDEDISLRADLNMDEMVALENIVEQTDNVSALVEAIGGVGIYPTMVTSSSDFSWLVEVVAHEWIHNYLTWHPLGINYFTTPQLRTMNETTASLAGKEISKAMLARYYPEYLPPPTPATVSQPAITPPAHQSEASPPPFNFHKEMHSTRITVDGLLAEGKVQEAETYMEMRRQFLFNNGYQIRRLNQAYFAFHGAYDDLPGGGAAGKDPVGPAVRALRAQNTTLVDFLSQIAWMTSFETLEQTVKQH